MVLPDADKNISDALDFLSDGCSYISEVEGENGPEKRQMVDYDRIYYKTQLVNHPNFSRFVLELENFKLMAQQAQYNMSGPRAKQLSEDILAYVRSFQLSIDAKSSETLRDKYNTQGALVHQLLSNKIEKSYNLKGETKKSFISGFLGRDGQEEGQG